MDSGYSWNAELSGFAAGGSEVGEERKRTQDHLQVSDSRNCKAGVARRSGFGERSRSSVPATLRDAVRRPSGAPVGSWIFESGATITAPLVHRWCVKLGAWGRHLGKEWGSWGVMTAGGCWVGHCRDSSKGAGPCPNRGRCGPHQGPCLELGGQSLRIYQPFPRLGARLLSLERLFTSSGEILKHL